MLEDVSGLDAAAWLRRCDEPAEPVAAGRIEALVRRRAAGEPLQHVLGHWSFRTLDVAVDGRALVPRPETEFVVAVALRELDAVASPSPDGPEARFVRLARRSRDRPCRRLVAVDLGTGSGVIGCSLVAERTDVEVIATDASADALGLAGVNRRRLDADAVARLRLFRGCWYEAVPEGLEGLVDLVVSNPPYLAEGEWDRLDPIVRGFDPKRALVAGPTGLEALEEVIAGAPRWLSPHGSLVVELAPAQAGDAITLATSAGLERARVEADLAGRPRVLVAHGAGRSGRSGR